MAGCREKEKKEDRPKTRDVRTKQEDRCKEGKETKRQKGHKENREIKGKGKKGERLISVKERKRSMCSSFKAHMSWR